MRALDLANRAAERSAIEESLAGMHPAIIDDFAGEAPRLIDVIHECPQQDFAGGLGSLTTPAVLALSTDARATTLLLALPLSPYFGTAIVDESLKALVGARSVASLREDAVEFVHGLQLPRAAEEALIRYAHHS